MVQGIEVQYQFQVLIQGHAVNIENVQGLLDTLKSKLCEYEVGAAESMAGVLPGLSDEAMVGIHLDIVCYSLL